MWAFHNARSYRDKLVQDLLLSNCLEPPSEGRSFHPFQLLLPIRTAHRKRTGRIGQNQRFQVYRQEQWLGLGTAKILPPDFQPLLASWLCWTFPSYSLRAKDRHRPWLRNAVAGYKIKIDRRWRHRDCPCLLRWSRLRHQHWCATILQPSPAKNLWLRSICRSGKTQRSCLPHSSRLVLVWPRQAHKAQPELTLHWISLCWYSLLFCCRFWMSEWEYGLYSIWNALDKSEANRYRFLRVRMAKISCYSTERCKLKILECYRCYEMCARKCWRYFTQLIVWRWVEYCFVSYESATVSTRLCTVRLHHGTVL